MIGMTVIRGGMVLAPPAGEDCRTGEAGSRVCGHRGPTGIRRHLHGVGVPRRLIIVVASPSGLPTAEEVLALRRSAELDRRLDELLAKSKATGLSEEEQREWDAYEYVEHRVRLAKARAQRRLKSASY